MCYTFCLSMDFHRRLPPAAAALPRRPRRPFRACAAWRPRRSPRHRSRRRCPTAWDDEPWKMGRWVDVWGWVDRISYGSTVLDGFQWVLWVGCGLMIWRSQNPVVRTWLARAWYFWWTGRLGWCRVDGNILQLIRVASILLYLRWLWFFDVLWTCESEAQEIECHREFGKDLDCGCGTDAGLSASCHVNTMNYSLALGIAWAIGQNIGVASGNSQGVS